HRLDDARRADASGDHQRVAAAAHRARQRHQRAGREPAPEAARTASEDDETVQGHGGQAGPHEGPAGLSVAEGVTTWRYRSGSDVWVLRSARPTGWSWRTRAHRATAASSRSSDTTTLSRSRRP